MNFRTIVQNPALIVSVGITASLAFGVGLYWREAAPLIEAAAAKIKPVEEKKEKGWDFWTIEIENLSSELKEERARMRKQEEALNQRAARLAAEEKELAKVRGEIEALRKEIADKVIEINADEVKNIRTLSQTYSNLSPRAVVAIFRELDDTTAVKILSLMKPDVVGPIFEEMSQAKGASANDAAMLARRAAVLSEKLRLMKATKPASPS
jgi:flagellar motility protein MotE (MotC chaperone)